MECSRNDGSKTQYYVVILDRLQGRSGAPEQALESRIRGPLTIMMVWALPTGSFLSTIPGILKPNHGIQDDMVG